MDTYEIERHIHDLKKCSLEYKNYRTPPFETNVSDLCDSTAALLEAILKLNEVEERAAATNEMPNCSIHELSIDDLLSLQALLKPNADQFILSHANNGNWRWYGKLESEYELYSCICEHISEANGKELRAYLNFVEVDKDSQTEIMGSEERKDGKD